MISRVDDDLRGQALPGSGPQFRRAAVLGPANAEPARDAGALWPQLRQEAEQALATAPALARLLAGSILEQTSLETALFHRISERLKNDTVGQPVLLETFRRAAQADARIGLGLLADIAAVLERDPAATRLIEPFLYFKGFHALQVHRLTHWLWSTGERDLALYLQSRSSELFQTDIHPAARIGRGIFLDHATGLVVGGTAVIEDDVSLLQNVTLGATGKTAGDRHPKVRRGAIIGAGAKVLGNIEVGEQARVAAGSVVLATVPPGTTVAGVPARPVRTSLPAGSEGSVGQVLQQLSYQGFDYTI